MRPEHEYRHLADSTRRRGYVEQSALRAQWEILAWEISAATYRVDAAADALRASSKRTSVGATSVTQTSLRVFCIHLSQQEFGDDVGDARTT